MANLETTFGPSADPGETGRPHLRTVAPWLLIMGLAGCTAGPDFKRPSTPEVAGYTATPVAAQTESAAVRLGEAQRLVNGMVADAQWWRNLKSAELDALIESALNANPSLAAAQAALRQAREIHVARAGSTQYPQVEIGRASCRERV